MVCRKNHIYQTNADVLFVNVFCQCFCVYLAVDHSLQPWLVHGQRFVDVQLTL
jgi:hypothetical protein